MWSGIDIQISRQGAELQAKERVAAEGLGLERARLALKGHGFSRAVVDAKGLRL
jgi:hypothetical protein